MITRQLINDVNELKHEIIMLQSLSQLVHDSIEFSSVGEINHCMTVSQDIANRLWTASQQIESLEKALEGQLEVTV